MKAIVIVLFINVLNKKIYLLSLICICNITITIVMIINNVQRQYFVNIPCNINKQNSEYFL